MLERCLLPPTLRFLCTLNENLRILGLKKNLGVREQMCVRADRKFKVSVG